MQQRAVWMIAGVVALALGVAWIAFDPLGTPPANDTGAGIITDAPHTGPGTASASPATASPPKAPFVPNVTQVTPTDAEPPAVETLSIDGFDSVLNAAIEECGLGGAIEAARMCEPTGCGVLLVSKPEDASTGAANLAACGAWSAAWGGKTYRINEVVLCDDGAVQVDFVGPATTQTDAHRAELAQAGTLDANTAAFTAQLTESACALGI